MEEEHPHNHGQTVLNDVVPLGRQLRQMIPDVYKKFAELDAAALGDGEAVSAKTKQLIALAIAVTRQCDGCIASHARSAARAGATTNEVAEVLGVAILMTGGPGTVHAPRAYDAFVEFKSKI